jgi:hypothetical protein
MLPPCVLNNAVYSVIKNLMYFYLLKRPFNANYFQMQIMVESWIVCRMDLLLSFVNLSIKEFLESSVFYFNSNTSCTCFSKSSFAIGFLIKQFGSDSGSLIEFRLETAGDSMNILNFPGLAKI